MDAIFPSWAVAAGEYYFIFYQTLIRRKFIPLAIWGSLYLRHSQLRCPREGWDVSALMSNVQPETHVSGSPASLLVVRSKDPPVVGT